MPKIAFEPCRPARQQPRQIGLAQVQRQLAQILAIQRQDVGRAATLTPLQTKPFSPAYETGLKQNPGYQ
jgi:hypothetical protein